MSLASSQAEIDGLLLGEGTDYKIKAIRGFGVDPVRNFDRVNQGQDGGYGGRDLLPIKRLGMTVSSLAVTPDDLAEKMVPHSSDADFHWLRFRWRDMAATRRVKVRPDTFPPELVEGYGVTGWEGEAQWRAVDPRFYADIETVVNVGQAASAGGLTFPLTYPRTYGSGGSGVVFLENEGKTDTFMTATITGPAGGPRLEYVGLGLQVNMAGLTLSAGETVVVDFQARSVLLNGTSDRFNTLTSASRFFPLNPGSNEVRFATQTGSTATAELRFRSAWLVGSS